MIAIYGKTIEAFYFGLKLLAQGQSVVIAYPDVASKHSELFPLLVTHEMQHVIHPADMPLNLYDSNQVKLSYLGDTFSDCSLNYFLDLYESNGYFAALSEYFRNAGGTLLVAKDVTFNLKDNLITGRTVGYRFDQAILTAIPDEPWFSTKLENYSIWHTQGLRGYRKGKDEKNFTLILGVGSDTIGYRVVLEDLKPLTCYGAFGYSKPDLKSLNSAFSVRAKFLAQTESRMRIGSPNQAKRFMQEYPIFYCCGFAYGFVNPGIPQSGFNLALQDHMLQSNDFIGLDSGNLLRLVKSEYIAKLLTTPLGASKVIERLDTMIRGH